jgi:hypothetical protein
MSNVIKVNFKAESKKRDRMAKHSAVIQEAVEIHSICQLGNTTHHISTEERVKRLEIQMNTVSETLYNLVFQGNK